MAHTVTLTINGSAIDQASAGVLIDRLTPYQRGGIPSLEFTRFGGVPGALPDPWSGKPCSLAIDGTTVFAGDVLTYQDSFEEQIGWTRRYEALGLQKRAAYVPVTDALSLTDESVWNLPGDDPDFVAARAGQTVGQIAAEILTMAANAAPLSAAGLGAYTSTSPWSLPAATASDLAALTVVPPWPVRVAGEGILAALEAFVQSCHPNHWMHVEPDGTVRFFDVRTAMAAPATVTIGSDPRLGLPLLSRDLSERYSRLLVRGAAQTVPVTLQTQPWHGSSLTDGGLQEDFAWGSYTNAQAKANWTPSDYSQPNQFGAAQDVGSCTCPDTEHVTVSSADAARTWAANYWGQGAGEALGYVIVSCDSLAGEISQYFTAMVVSNTALAAGGTSTLTLDRPLPATSYTSYQLFGLAAGPNVVGRRYKVTNPVIAAAMADRFSFPVPYLSANGSAAEMTSTPIGQVMWGGSGVPPYYSTGVDGITLDPVGGLIYFDEPTQVVAGGYDAPTTWPANVQAFVPIATSPNEAWAPSATTWGGTLYTVEGIERQKTITVSSWRDYSNSVNMQTYANETFDALKDAIVEGTLPYHDLPPSAFLAPGGALEIAGAGFATGWETTPLPIASVEIAFSGGPAGTSFSSVYHLSNRRGAFSPSNFLRPNIAGQSFGTSEQWSPFAPEGSGKEGK